MTDHDYQDDRYQVEDFFEAYECESEIIGEIREIFLVETPEKIQQLRTAVGQNDLELVGRICHSFANSCGTVRAENALSLARAAEMAIRAGDAREASNLVSRLIEQIGIVLQEIRKAEPPG